MQDEIRPQPSIRRKYQRVPVRVSALVHSRGRFQTVTIVDFSQNGLQLLGAFGLAASDDVVVELLSGHRLPARVVWSLGSRLGTRFLQPLLLHHPATISLHQAAMRRCPAERNVLEEAWAAGD